jgi:hypothetical protein
MDLHNAPIKSETLSPVGESPAASEPANAPAPAPAASLETPAPEQEVAIIENPPVVTTETTAAPSPTPVSARFTMQPIADDELVIPAAPKATTAPKPVTPPAKDKVAETTKPAPMLRKSQAPISIAASE